MSKAISENKVNKIKSCKPSSQLIKLLWILFAFAITYSLLYMAGKQPWALSTQTILDWAWKIAAITLTGASFYDYLLATKTKLSLSISRQYKEILPLHHWSTITLTIKHQYNKTRDIKVMELTPQTLELSEPSLNITLKPQQQTSIEYSVRPMKRGDADILGTELLISSPLGLWQTVITINERAKLKIYPDYKTIYGYSLLAVENHTSQMGIKKIQKRGEGMEFHQLREYMRGDTSRQIDWKATARKQKLISRDYQDERDQQIIVLLDNGRRMRNHSAFLGHLDHSVNAMALLSHIALKQGDAVGLMSFGQQQKWLPCKKGSAHINNILNHVYDLQPQMHATDYSAAAEQLVKLQRKRSLVILITNTRDEDIDDLLPAIKLIGKNHLILLANIQEPELHQAIEQPVTDVTKMYHYCGTLDYLNRREKVKQQLTEQGVFVIDALPQDLPIKVCNSYLEIKRSGYL